jgi:hypothetical protein
MPPESWSDRYAVLLVILVVIIAINSFDSRDPQNRLILGTVLAAAGIFFACWLQPLWLAIVASVVCVLIGIDRSRDSD